MVYEYRANWEVQGGGPGNSVFHFQDIVSPSDPTDIPGRVDTFMKALQTLLPDEVLISYDNEVRQLNTSSGVLEAVFPVTPPAAFSGTGSGVFGSAQGFQVVWDTGVIGSNGRRIRGRTFLVPSPSISNSGQVLSTAATTAETAAAAFITGTTADNTPLAVWSRINGAAPAVTVGTVPDKQVILRTRRD